MDEHEEDPPYSLSDKEKIEILANAGKQLVKDLIKELLELAKNIIDAVTTFIKDLIASWSYTYKLFCNSVTLQQAVGVKSIEELAKIVNGYDAQILDIMLHITEFSELDTIMALNPDGTTLATVGQYRELLIEETRARDAAIYFDDSKTVEEREKEMLNGNPEGDPVGILESDELGITAEEFGRRMANVVKKCGFSWADGDKKETDHE